VNACICRPDPPGRRTDARRQLRHGRPAKPEPRVPATPEERPDAGIRLSPWIWIPLLVAAVAAIAWFARG
jgi:hypothetical protein